PVQTFTITIDTTPTVIQSQFQLSATLPTPPSSGTDPNTNLSSFDVAGSDSGPTAALRTGRVTEVVRPGFEGGVDQSGPVTVQSFDDTAAGSPVLLASGTTDANGRFQLTTAAGIYRADGSTDGAKTIRIRVSNVTKSSQLSLPGFFTL